MSIWRWLVCENGELAPPQIPSRRPLSPDACPVDAQNDMKEMWLGLREDEVG